MIVFMPDDLGDDGPLQELHSYNQSMVYSLLYAIDELPYFAVCLSEVLQYISDTYNGGHGQYLGNANRIASIPGDIADRCIDAFEILELRQHQEICRNLVSYINNNKSAAEGAAASHGFNNVGPGYLDDELVKLEKQLFALDQNGEGAYARVLEFLRSHPQVKFMEHKSIPKELAIQALNNPHRRERLAKQSETKSKAFYEISGEDMNVVHDLCIRAGCEFENILLPYPKDRSIQISVRPEGATGMAPSLGTHIETTKGWNMVCFSSQRYWDKARTCREFESRTAKLFAMPSGEELSSISFAVPEKPQANAATSPPGTAVPPGFVLIDMFSRNNPK